MKRTRITTATLVVTALLLPGAVFATTREISELQQVPLTFRQSVVNQLSRDQFWDPYDELQRRAFNLPFVNMDRYGNLSPWPGQEGEQINYLNAFIGNNGNTNLQNGADTITGAYIRKPGGSFNWGVSASYLSNELDNGSVVANSTFSDSDGLTGFDLRFAAAYRLSGSLSLGGGIELANRDDTETDSSFDQGVGGFFGSNSLQQDGVTIDFGARGFMGPEAQSSWQAQVAIGFGTTDLLDFSETLDGNGSVTDRFVLTNYEIGDTLIRLSGAYNRLYSSGKGEMQAQLAYGISQHSLDNSDLSFANIGGVVTPTITLVGDDPVSDNTLLLSFSSVNYAGPTTEVFSGARLSWSNLEGSTTIDSLGTIVNERIDDQLIRLGLSLGLRQPLGTERLRLIASAHSDFVDLEESTIFDTASTTTSGTQTTSQYGVGVEGVFSNITFDLAWLFGEEVSFSDSNLSRQIIEFDRLVVSAMFAW